MKAVFLAHPVGAATRAEHLENLERAKRWVRWVIDSYPGYVVVAAWLYYCEALDDARADHRELGQLHGHELIKRCDEIWLVGGRVSAGMKRDLEVAYEHGLQIRNFTGICGTLPPENPPLLTEVAT